MAQVLNDVLSLGAKSAIVHSFKKLVYYSLGQDFESDNSESNSSIPPRFIAELDDDLYSKAESLPEKGSVPLETIEEVGKYQYGDFIGGAVYSTYNGDIDSNNKNVKACSGWLIRDHSSEEYALFRSGDKTYIIALDTFTPKAVVKDFTPLYKKLQESLKGSHSDQVKDDTRAFGALAASNAGEMSYMQTHYVESEYEAPTYGANNKGSKANADKYTGYVTSVRQLIASANIPYAGSTYYKAWLAYMKAMYLYEGAVLLAKEIEDRWEALLSDNAGIFGAYPKQLIDDVNYNKKLSAYDDIQAVVYAIPPASISDASLKNGVDVLVSYQSPESISYTSQAQYDAVTTRGTQIPLQYYNSANQIDMTFTMKWHIDEVRTFGKNVGEAYTLQDIADAAERLTRPWDTNGSNKPKLCKVILPSITRIGYITSANITYSGDFTGSSLGVVTSNSDVTFSTSAADQADMLHANEYSVGITDYGFTQLEVTFNMIIVQDITLLAIDTNGNVISEGYLKTPIIDTDTIGKQKDLVDKIKEGADLTVSTGYAAKNAVAATAAVAEALTALATP